MAAASICVEISGRVVPVLERNAGRCKGRSIVSISSIRGPCSSREGSGVFAPVGGAFSTNPAISRICHRRLGHGRIREGNCDRRIIKRGLWHATLAGLLAGVREGPLVVACPTGCRAVIRGPGLGLLAVNSSVIWVGHGRGSRVSGGMVAKLYCVGGRTGRVTSGPMASVFSRAMYWEGGGGFLRIPYAASNLRIFAAHRDKMVDFFSRAVRGLSGAAITFVIGKGRVRKNRGAAMTTLSQKTVVSDCLGRVIGGAISGVGERDREGASRTRSGAALAPKVGTRSVVRTPEVKGREAVGISVPAAGSLSGSVVVKKISIILWDKKIKFLFRPFLQCLHWSGAERPCHAVGPLRAIFPV